MADRKQTPDVLGEILGGEAQPPSPEPAATAKPEQPRKPRRQQSRRRAREPSAKDKWEYLVVSLQEYKGWRPRYVNGQELADWMDAPLVHDYVNQLGKEGWELVSASSGQSLYGLTDRHQLYFKRTKS
jgi:hypothetical protein